MPVQKTPEGTHGTRGMGPKWLRRLMEPLAKRGIESYRKTGGRNRMATMMGFPVVLLTTKGAKSGAERTVSVGGFAEGDDAWLIVASNSGSAHHPSWFKNMVRHPDEISLEVGSRKMRVRCDSLTGSEREAALARIATISARYGKYPTKTDREIPIVRLTRISG